jgi:epoxyqueuosine reductase
MVHSQVSTVNDIAAHPAGCYGRLAMRDDKALDDRAVAAFMGACGVDLWGAAEVRPDWPAAPDLPTAISFALRLRPHSLDGLELGPNEAEVSEYRRANDELVEIGEACVTLLRAHGHRAERVDDDAPDGPTDPEIFASKTAATQAGLGWIGKTALLVTPRYGASVRLGTVFTDLSLPAGTPVTTGRCGSCRKCVDACPVGAGRDIAWRAGLPRRDLYDCAACDTYQRRFPEFDEICGICIWVCPYTRRAFRRDERGSGRDRKAEKGERR